MLDHESVLRSFTKLILDKVLLSCRQRDTEIIVTRSVLPFLYKVEQFHQNVMVERVIVGNNLLQRTSVLVIRILQRMEGEMGHNTIVTRTAAENCEKKILIRLLRAAHAD